jgi:hypothetical protein
MDEVSCTGPTTVWGVGVDLEGTVGKEVLGSLEIERKSIDGVMVTIMPDMVWATDLSTQRRCRSSTLRLLNASASSRCLWASEVV